VPAPESRHPGPHLDMLVVDELIPAYPSVMDLYSGTAAYFSPSM
jgi:hypothetical protein